MAQNLSDLDLNLKVDLNQDENPNPEKNQKKANSASANPKIQLFALLFKGISIAIYLFGGLIFSNISIFIQVTILMAIDFWFTKNVAGRMLVGLRWQSVFDDEGNQQWVFESKDEKNNHAGDSTVFWGSLVTNIFYIIKGNFVRILAFIFNSQCFEICLLHLISKYFLFCFSFYQPTQLLQVQSMYLFNEEQQKKIKEFKNQFVKQGAQTLINQFIGEQK